MHRTFTAIFCAGTGALIYSFIQYYYTPRVKNNITQLIGDTPLVRIDSLSQLSGCEILGKLELNNPGGSAKDRVALAIIDDAESKGLLRRGERDHVYEGTSGSTGISLALICNARGYEAHIVVPDDTSAEKLLLLEKLGAHVHLVRPASIIDADHYVNVARRLAKEVNEFKKGTQAIFANQFETECNWTCHLQRTGPEIWNQTMGNIDAFVTGAGTGGTISGVAKYLKSKNSAIKVFLADPPGSGLYNKVRHGVMYDPVEREGTRRRHQVDTIVEGIGINRLTNNLQAGLEYIDDAFRVSDDEAVIMSHFLVEKEGLFLGSSSGVNCTAVYKAALKLGPGHTLVTVLCDSGSRHLSKFWQAPVNKGCQLYMELYGWP